eukprot:COSAG01_NODE_5171_length_4436_cov_4.031128_2_plen_91_part_00
MDLLWVAFVKEYFVVPWREDCITLGVRQREVLRLHNHDGCQLREISGDNTGILDLVVCNGVDDARWGRVAATDRVEGEAADVRATGLKDH